MGAANGRRADGGQLRSQQGDEVWVGTSYAFAADLVLHGLAAEGLHTAYGVYQVVYSPYGQGYFFKTPEAYLDPDETVWNDPAAKYGERTFRAMKYMRPGAVWALYEALRRNGEKTAQEK
jgi:non-lysosomal glucosylceramidase